MIIDLILDRKDTESSNEVAVCDIKLSGFYVPVAEAYPDADIPEEAQGCYCYRYNARAFYHAVMGYGEVGHGIARALDFGEEADVKRELCSYIDLNEYNPAIKDYVNSVDWLTPED